MDQDKFYQQIDVPRNAWDPTEVSRHSRYGERSFSEITGVEVHWVGTGAVADHGDTGTELLGFERYHEVTKGWYDLFYQVAVDSEGITYEGRNATIPSQSSLRNWLTVLVIQGDRDTEPPPPIVYQRIYDIWGTVNARRDPSTLRYHGERASTSCPGPDIKIGVELLRGGWNPGLTTGASTNMNFEDLPDKGVPSGVLAELATVDSKISNGANPGELAARWEAILLSNRAYVESKKYLEESKKYTDEQVAVLNQRISQALGSVVSPDVDIDDIVAKAAAKVLRDLDGSSVKISETSQGTISLG